MQPDYYFFSTRGSVNLKYVQPEDWRIFIMSEKLIFPIQVVWYIGPQYGKPIRRFLFSLFLKIFLGGMGV